MTTFIPGDVPAADDVTAGWWDATREHRLVVQTCGLCGHGQHPPRAVCTGCGATEPSPCTAASGSGVVDTWTVVHRAPRPEVPRRRTWSRGFGSSEGPILLTRLEHAGRSARRRVSRSTVRLGSTCPTAVPSPSSVPPTTPTITRGLTWTSSSPTTSASSAALLRTFVDKEIMPVAREWEQTGRYPTEIVKGMTEMGLFGITIPEEYGGLDLDPVSFALVFEEISRGWMGIAGILGSHSLACRMIARHGTEEQKQALPARARHRRAAHRHRPHRADAGTDLQGIRTTARRDGDHYVVNGTKMWITNARHADPLPVLVKTDPTAAPAHRGMSILLVEPSLDGLPGHQGHPASSATRAPSPARSCSTTCGCRSTACSAASRAPGMQQALSALEWGRINIAARSVGIAQRAYDEALRYAKERHAFGQPIARASRRSSSSWPTWRPSSRRPG